MSLTDATYGVINNPLLITPFLSNNKDDEKSISPIQGFFLLLNGNNFKLLSGGDFLLL